MPQPTITYRNSTTYQPYAPYIRLLFALLFSVIGTHVYAHTSIERHILAGDKVLGKQQLNLMHTNDSSNDIVTVPNECLDEFKHFAETYNAFGMKEAYDAIGWNDYWKSEFGLAEQQLSNEHLDIMNMLNSDWSKQKAIAFWMNPTGWNATKYSVREGLSQWTNLELVEAGLSAGVYGLQAVRSMGRVAAKGRSTTLRQVGKVFESVDDVLTNPSLLKGQSYAQVRGGLNGSKGWVNSVMTRTRGLDKGWVFRQVNGKGQPTGCLIQYHPGSRRHFGGNPYWKVSDGTNIFRLPVN